LLRIGDVVLDRGLDRSIGVGSFDGPDLSGRAALEGMIRQQGSLSGVVRGPRLYVDRAMRIVAA
jgi:hypothetical protein